MNNRPISLESEKKLAASLDFARKRIIIASETNLPVQIIIDVKGSSIHISEIHKRLTKF